MAKRTGLPTIRELCNDLCTFLAIYIPIIKKAFPDEAELIAALELVSAAACACVAASDEVIVLGD